MPRPTKAEIIAALDKFAADPLASDTLSNVVDKHLGDSLSRVNSYLGQADAGITLGGIQKALKWIKDNFDQLKAAQKTAARTRLQELRVSATTVPEVKKYLAHAMRRYASLGDDDDTALARLQVLMAKDAADVDAVEFQHLMDRAKAVWEDLS